MELIETCFLTSVAIYHKSVTLGGNTEHFTTNVDFRSYGLAQWFLTGGTRTPVVLNRGYTYEALKQGVRSTKLFLEYTPRK